MHVKWKLLTHLTEVIKAVVNIKMANTKTKSTAMRSLLIILTILM